ncbi:unnamed protein product [Coffea canephora]|uniref:SAM domain-containing protein n=2 Tax=Coffea TaxID=13442 RepID=A0A068TPQ4_COFCA|nr:uncharacterized protein LOC113738769 [Coffea arabica]CDO98191.1 unnamed protein product [Coffea canephora]
MDWFSWLSKTSLDPSTAYDYALTFAQNELEEDDIAHFNHEFLQSMGISLAKHRLEILKFARKDKTRSLRPMLRLLIAVKQAKNYVAKHIRVRVGQDSSAHTMIPVPQMNKSSRWKAAMLRANRKLIQTTKRGRPTLLASGTNSNTPPVVAGQEILMLTNGSPLESDSSSNSSSDTDVQDFHFHNEKLNCSDGEFWSNGIEELKWETMFQNLKPT